MRIAKCHDATPQEAVMAECVPEHVGLYQHLRPFLRRDLVSLGIPNPDAGRILNWFDPANCEYLERVDAWQKMLCRQYVAVPPPFLHVNAEGLIVEPVWVIRAIHQVAKLVYKWHGTPAKKTDWCAVAERLSNPLPIRLTDDEIEGIRQCLSSINPIDLNQARGRFGPGATAEGFDALQKWMRIGSIPDVPPNLYRVNPHDPWTPKSGNPFRVTKATEVPKSIKANRVVSSEPAMSMYAQLAINDDLVDQIHRIFAGHVSLHDQDRHNELLHRGDVGTLDLSDASDHIQCELVMRVLPQLWPVLAQVRSEYSLLPEVGIVPLRTFAPMGAGFCFSVMTTVILGIIAYAFKSLCYSWRREPWSVYGDDIIVPIWIIQYVMDLLERAGLVINLGKSCMTPMYVESCGLELYRGFDITPVYLKDPLDTLEASKCEQIAQKLGELTLTTSGASKHERTAYKLGEFMPATLEEILKLSHPIKGMRWNRNLQCIEYLVRTRSVRSKVKSLDDFAGLNRWFSIGSQQELDQVNKPRWPSGVECEVWTKIAWRYRSAINYPCLAEKVSTTEWFTQGC